VKSVFVVMKIFVKAPTATEVFTRIEKMFLQIFRVKAVYFNLFGGFAAVADERGSSHPCQLCMFFRCSKMWKSGES
jgi:hypothetical protein